MMGKQKAPDDKAKTAAWKREVATMLRVLADRVDQEQDLMPVEVESMTDYIDVTEHVIDAVMQAPRQLKVSVTFVPVVTNRKENEHG